MSAPRLTLCLVLIGAFLAPCPTLARPARAQESGWASESVPAITIAVEDASTSSWSPLVDGNELNDGLYSLALDDAGRALYAAGRFTSAGGVSATHIAKWNGAAWSPLGSGLMNEGVAALAVDSSRSHVYVAGWFATAGGVSAGRTAMWDARTSSWSALGSGMNFSVNTLALDGNGQTLYAGGEFTTAGGIPANYIARWGPTTIAPIEQPGAGAIVTGTVTISGFAIDLASPTGTGIDMVHIYLDGPDGTGAFIGAATYGLDRPDVAAEYGARFGPSGWELAWDTNGIAPGVHRLYLYAHRTIGNVWSQMPPHLVVMRAAHGIWLPLGIKS